MFKEIGAIMGLLSVPHNNVLKLDRVANPSNYKSEKIWIS